MSPGKPPSRPAFASTIVEPDWPSLEDDAQGPLTEAEDGRVRITRLTLRLLEAICRDLAVQSE